VRLSRKCCGTVCVYYLHRRSTSTAGKAARLRGVRGTCRHGHGGLARDMTTSEQEAARDTARYQLQLSSGQPRAASGSLNLFVASYKTHMRAPSPLSSTKPKRAKQTDRSSNAPSDAHERQPASKRERSTQRRAFGVSVFRCFGVSVFRCFGVSVFRCFGVSVFRCFGVSVFRCCFSASSRAHRSRSRSHTRKSVAEHCVT